MEELKQIDLNQTQEPESSPQASTGPKRRFRFSKKTFIPLVILGILMLWLIVGIIIPGKLVYDQGVKAYRQGVKAYDSAKQQNVEQAAIDLKETHKEMLETKRKLQAFGYTKYIPLTGVYYSDAEHSVNAAIYGIEAAQIALDSVVPYADLLGLKGQGSFVLGSAEERIKKAVETLDKVTPKIADIEEKVVLLKKELDYVNPNRYPELGKYKIKSRLQEAKTLIDQTEVLVTEARPLVEVLPELLGAREDKKYLVIFQNDKELRPTGGFVTGYAIFRLEKGRAIAESADDIYTLDGRRTRRVAAPELIRKYLPSIGGGATTAWQMRDGNISPDFKESMIQIHDFYNQVPGAAEVDGIIAVDTQFLVEVVRILGGIDVYGKQFTAESDDRCNCPNVVYELSDAITRPVGFVRSGRKDIIGVLLSEIMRKSLSSAPRIYWGPLFQSGLTAISEKHILFYLLSENAQKGIESLNAGGRIKETKGDYLHINDANMAGAKSNMYVRQSVVHEVNVEGEQIVKTLTIDYKNPQPSSDCNLERGGLCLNGILRNVLRVYVPQGSELIEHQGLEEGPDTYEELGKTVFEGFMTVKPQGKATVVLKYRLPKDLERKGNTLPLLIQKQPGTEGNEYIIKVNGKEKEKFQLREDKELSLTL